MCEKSFCAMCKYYRKPSITISLRYADSYLRKVVDICIKNIKREVEKCEDYRNSYEISNDIVEDPMVKNRDNNCKDYKEANWFEKILIYWDTNF
jgi:hypothetical protein